MNSNPPDHIRQLIENTKWRCHACGEMRPDKYIKVYKHDVSAQYNFDSGTLIHNFRYCSDNHICVDKASRREFKDKS